MDTYCNYHKSNIVEMRPGNRNLTKNTSFTDDGFWFPYPLTFHSAPNFRARFIFFWIIICHPQASSLETLCFQHFPSLIIHVL